MKVRQLILSKTDSTLKVYRYQFVYVKYSTLSAGAVEYGDCTSIVEYDSPHLSGHLLAMGSNL